MDIFAVIRTRIFLSVAAFLCGAGVGFLLAELMRDSRDERWFPQTGSIECGAPSSVARGASDSRSVGTAMQRPFTVDWRRVFRALARYREGEYEGLVPAGATESYRALVRRHFATLASREAESVSAICAPGATDWYPDLPEGVRQLFSGVYPDRSQAIAALLSTRSVGDPVFLASFDARRAVLTIRFEHMMIAPASDNGTEVTTVESTEIELLIVDETASSSLRADSAYDLVLRDVAMW